MSKKTFNFDMCFNMMRIMMKTKSYLLLIIVGSSLFLSGCSKKNPSSTIPAEPNKSSGQQQSKRHEVNRPKLKLEYADDIDKLALQIAAILDNIETPEDAEQAIKTLKPLGKEYRKLNQKFSKYYLQETEDLFSTN